LVFFLLIHKATNVDNLVGNWPGHFKEWIWVDEYQRCIPTYLS
jgi:hypothetical protein